MANTKFFTIRKGYSSKDSIPEGYPENLNLKHPGSGKECSAELYTVRESNNIGQGTPVNRIGSCSPVENRVYLQALSF